MKKDETPDTERELAGIRSVLEFTYVITIINTLCVILMTLMTSWYMYPMLEVTLRAWHLVR